MNQAYPIVTDEKYSKFFSSGSPIKPKGASEPDPIVHNGNGQWFFWTETWSELYGPYRSSEEAVEACSRYASSL